MRVGLHLESVGELQSEHEGLPFGSRVPHQRGDLEATVPGCAPRDGVSLDEDAVGAVLISGARVGASVGASVGADGGLGAQRRGRASRHDQGEPQE